MILCLIVNQNYLLFLQSRYELDFFTGHSLESSSALAPPDPLGNFPFSVPRWQASKVVSKVLSKLLNLYLHNGAPLLSGCQLELTNGQAAQQKHRRQKKRAAMAFIILHPPQSAIHLPNKGFSFRHSSSIRVLASPPGVGLRLPLPCQAQS